MTGYAVVQQKNPYLVRRNVEESLSNDIVKLLRICQILLCLLQQSDGSQLTECQVFASVLLVKQSVAWVEHEHHLML